MKITSMQRPLACALLAACLPAGLLAAPGLAPSQEVLGRDLSAVATPERLAELRLNAKVDGVSTVLRDLRRDQALLESYIRARADAKSAPALGKSLGQLWVLELELLGQAGQGKEAAKRRPNFVLVQSTTDQSADSLVLGHAAKAAAREIAAYDIASGTALLQDSTIGSETGAARQPTEIRRQVMSSLRRGESSFLSQMDHAIEDVLVEIVLDAKHPGELSFLLVQPLTQLAKIEPKRAIEVGLLLLGRSERGWAGMVAESLAGKPMVAAVKALPAGELAASSPYELLQRLRASDEVDRKQAASMLLPFLARGLDTPWTREACIDLLEELSGQISFYQPELRWLHEILLASSDEVQRMAGVSAMLRYSNGVELTRKLADDPSESVRSKAAQEINGIIPHNSEAPDDVRELWLRFTSDPSDRVRSAAYQSLGKVITQSNRSPLSPLEVARIVIRFESPDELRLWEGLPKLLPYWTEKWGARDYSGEEVGEACALILGNTGVADRGVILFLARNNDWTLMLVSFLRHLNWADYMAKYTLSATGLDRGALERLPFDLSLDLYADLVSDPTVPDYVLEMLIVRDRRSKSNGRLPRIQLSLDALGAQRAVRLLLAPRVLAGSSAVEFLNESDWSESVDLLGQASVDTSLSPSQRAMALLALARVGRLDGLEEKLNRECQAVAKSPGGEQGLEQIFLWRQHALVMQPEADLQLLVGLLAEATIPTGALQHYAGLDLNSAGLAPERVQMVLALMEERVVRGEGRGYAFGGLMNSGLEALGRLGGTFPTNLVLSWARDSSVAVKVAAVAALAEREDVVSQIRKLLAADLGRIFRDNQFDECLGRLLAIPGVETVQLVMDYALGAKSASRRNAAISGLRSILELRELRTELRGDTTPAATRAGAIVELLTLMQHNDEVIRLEAIRGLATLGAVEQLPRLIQFVGSGTPEERKAAKEALAALNRQALAQPQNAD